MKKVINREFRVLKDSDVSHLDVAIRKIREVAKKHGYKAVSDMIKSIDDFKEETVEEFVQDLRNAVEPMLDGLSNQFNLERCRISAYKQKVGGEWLVAYKPIFERDGAETMKRFLNLLDTGLAKYHPRASKIKPQKEGEKIGIINFSDLHLDKMTCYEETGSESDIYKNIDATSTIFSELLAKQKEQGLSKNIIMIGNDLNNVNDLRGTTVKGTNQSTYIHHVDAWALTLDFWIEQIDKALNISPLIIVGIPGNHSRDMENMLMKALSRVYRNNKYIEFHDTRIERKAITYGNNLFFFEHGHNFNKKNYSSVMASHYSQIWATHPHRYAFLGHIHQEKTFDLPGIKVETARATCEDDEFHFNKGYLGIPKTAYAHWFSKCGKWTGRCSRIF